jgi:undecaprenyl-diphosphatase
VAYPRTTEKHIPTDTVWLLSIKVGEKEIVMSVNKMISTRDQDHQPLKNVFTGLRSPGVLAKWPMTGLIIFIFGSLMFGALTVNLFANGPLLAWDKAIADTLPAIGLKSPPIIKDLMIAGFYIGKEGVAALSLLLGLYFLYKRYWQELAMVVIGWAGSALIFNLLSHFIARPRPPTQIWIIVNIPGFPSGHAVAVVTFYGLMTYLLAPKMPSTFWKVAVVAVALLIIGFVGFSRVFTGGHYLTDILAGYAVGIAWFGVAYTLIELYFQNRRSRNVKKE